MQGSLFFLFYSNYFINPQFIGEFGRMSADFFTFVHLHFEICATGEFLYIALRRFFIHIKVFHGTFFLSEIYTFSRLPIQKCYIPK